MPRKIAELELEFEIPTWNSNWDFGDRHTIKVPSALATHGSVNQKHVQARISLRDKASLRMVKLRLEILHYNVCDARHGDLKLDHLATKQACVPDINDFL